MNVRPLLCVLASLVGFNAVAEDNGAVHAAGSESVTRFIVKWRTATDTPASETNAHRKLAQSANVSVRSLRHLSSDIEVLHLESATSDSGASTLAALRANPDIEYAVPDRRRHPQAIPNDPRFTGQWYLQNAQPSSINAVAAWDTTTGSASVVVAFLDTGVRFDHPDLQRLAQGGKLLPGFDFVSADPKASSSSPDTFLIANDGDGWDADPSDPGDWVNSTDKQNATFSDCDVEDSSWHGTRVAGIIGASSNNAVGVTGISWGSALLPVRVLGKCGGFDSDIIAGMKWAAGIHVNGVPDNPNPARVINLSLGATGTCGSAYQDAITQITARGAVIVVSAGNESGHSVDEPADCPGVIGVAGLRHAGTKVGFSNIGPQISVSAPAGNCPTSGSCTFSIDTTYNLGLTTPTVNDYTDQLHPNIGTSFSAPIVSGVAALMLSVHSKYTSAQLIAAIQKTATAFPKSTTVPDCTVPTTANTDQLECNCTTSTCGAGMVNAKSAVAAAAQPLVVVNVSSTAVVGSTVNLDGTGSSAADNHPVTYAWTATDASGHAIAITSANAASASFVATAAGIVTVRLTLTDDQGATAFSETTVTTPTPPPAKSGGGGGATTYWMLLALATLGITRKHYTRSARQV